VQTAGARNSFITIWSGKVCNKGVASGWAQGAGLPATEMLFQILMLNFSWDMSKIHYFSNRFSKIAKQLLNL